MIPIHAELIGQAALWLQRNGHSIVITDMAHGGGETADAIGWRGTHSTLIECKASRADFRADAQKYFRRMPERGLGAHRYYCARIGMLKVLDLPPKWGLLEWDGTKLRMRLKAERFSQRGELAEMQLLVSALRRVGQSAPKGVSVKCYTYETKNRATLGVAIEKPSVTPAPQSPDPLAPSCPPQQA